MQHRRISVNSLAKCMQAFERIAKDAILQDLCPKGMGVSVNSPAKVMRAFGRIAEDAILHDLCPKSMGVSVVLKDFLITYLIKLSK